MKKIIYNNNSNNNSNKNTHKTVKIREKINNLKIDISYCINNYDEQISMIHINHKIIKKNLQMILI